MGMFDWLNCEYPLPVDGLPTTGWQTKDTPAQAMDVYTIRKDGSLWGQEYDIEDRSDPKGEGMARFIGMAMKVNHRDVPCNMTGEVVFYNTPTDNWKTGWVEFSAYFEDGKLARLNLIENREE